MIFVTGDCHGTFEKLSNKNFPINKSLTKDDIVVICGDCGCIWSADETNEEKYWLDWLNNRNFTTVFVDGNHENFDRLNNDYEIIEFYGGKAHKINDSVYHLMRGEVFEFEGKRFFAFGGAKSHDYAEILIKEHFINRDEFTDYTRYLRKKRRPYRTLGEDFFLEEMPSTDEYDNARKNLALVNYNVDFVVTHCAPLSILQGLKNIHIEDNELTRFFNTILDELTFKHWFCGHYHQEINEQKFTLLYNKVIKIDT